MKGVLELVAYLVNHIKLPDVELLFALSDSPVNDPRWPLCSSISRLMESDVPFPLGQGESSSGGTAVRGWDKRIRDEYLKVAKLYPWRRKKEKAIFRGALRVSLKQESDWKRTDRGMLYRVSLKRPDLFDVGFTDICDPDNVVDSSDVQGIQLLPRIALAHQQQFKYILSVGAWESWADRMRILPFMDSVIIKQEADSYEFFYPLMKPYVHYIPTKQDFRDLYTQVEWLRQHDKEARQIIKNANKFAMEYLSEQAMTEYVYLIILEYAKLITYKPRIRGYNAIQYSD